MKNIKFLLLLLVLASFYKVKGQVPVADFNLPAEICLEEQAFLENTSINAGNYEWDFCSYDNLQYVPQTQVLATNNYGSPFHLKIVENDNRIYGFVSGRTTNKIYRLDFGENPENTPIYNDLGGTSILNNPSGIDIKKIGDNWYGLVTGYASNKLYLLEFGTSLEATPNITDISNSLNLNLPMDVKIVVDSDNIFAFIINNASGEYPYLRLNFGTDITSAPIVDEFTVAGSNAITSIDIKRENAEWYGFLVSRNNQRLYRINFGSSISSSPTFSDVSTPTGVSLNDPGGLEIVKEIDSSYVFVQSRNGPLYKFHFGEDYSNLASVKDLGNVYSDNRNWGLEFVKFKSRWFGFNANFGNKIYRIDFPNSCNLENSVSSLENPVISSSQPGQTLISLKALDLNGFYSNITKQLTVNSSEAPLGEIVLNQSYCITNNIAFNLNTTDDIATYNWDFGDGNTSTTISPTHQYSSDGEYIITLEVESVAGCPNIFYDTLNILPEPQPEFTTVKTEYCTFESVQFSNITPFDYGENVVWSWDFNGAGTSTAQNPSYTFETPGTKTITLEANVLGCIQTYQSTLDIIEGPQVNFSYDRDCLAESIQFTNLSTGTNITGYLWDFGNGQSSTAENPQIIYNSSGNYTVSLTVSNSSGCENTVIQEIQIFEKVVDSIIVTEAIENLPFKLGIDWINDFDSTQILNYDWEIDGEIQTTDTANYTLPEGSYNINLGITTENGCVFNTQRSLEVLPSIKPIPNFYLPIEVCLDEQIQLENTSVNADKYEWDFCTNDLNELPKNGIELIDFDINNSIAFRIIKSGNNYFGFTFDRNSDEFYRLDFGENPSSVPTINNLGNIDGLFSGPVAIDFIKENDDWFGLVANTDANDIIKLSFGNSLSNIPSVVSITNFGTINKPEGLMISEHSDSILAFVMNGTKITRLNFGNSINNTAIATNISVPNSNRLWDFDIVKDSGDYVGVLSSFGNSNVYYLEFGSDLLSIPTIQQFDVTSLDLISPAGLELIKQDDNYYSLIQYRSGDLVRFSFGQTMNLSPLMENLGTVDIIPTTNNSYVQLIKDSSKWIGYTMNFGQSKLFKYEFENICSASSSFSQISSPKLNFSQPGTYPITLTAYHPNGNSASITKEITVNNNQAPEISFTTGENLCISNPIDFSSASDGIIATYDWDFGDGSQSALENPSHTYASAGTYAVKLNVTDTAGCNNLFVDSIRVFEEPVPDFQATAQGSLCSQKPLIFENLTVLPTEASFFWDFGDGNTSTDENPEHVYAAAGDYIVSQNINMAGCAIEKIDTITINPGPSVAFQVANTCLGEILQFENTSQGDFLAGYEWDFGDGTQSTQTNPNHRYDTAGVYNVLFTAFTTNGCDFTISQSVEIQPLAEVAFESDVACVGQPTQFTELVNIAQSNITDYFWDFGVSGTQTDISTAANPEFNFPAAGTYNVSLQVTTSDGCTTAGSQTITVNAAPQAEFEFEQSCINQTRLFSPLTTSNIIAHFWELENSQGEVVQSSQSENFSFLFSEAGTYQLTYRQQNESLCSSSSSQTFTIHEQPMADFSWGTACANEAIAFENLSELNGNTLANYSWSIDGEFFSNNTHPQFTFEDSGEYLLRLEIETEEGCIQSIEKTITIAPSPLAFFELVQNIGAYPFTLNLVSPLGTEGLWTLNGDTISTTSELNHTIEQPGTYLLGLILTNEAGCVDEHYEQIRVREPNLDVSLSNLRINQDDEFTSFILNIANRGSLVPQRIDLDINVGSYSVSESIESPIYPESNRNFSLSLKLTEDQIKGLSKICIEATPRVGEHTDSNIQNNRICTNLESGFKVLDMYPNPAVSQFTIPLIVPESDVLNISMEDSNGRNVKVYNYNLEAGYNEIQIQRESFSPGIYFLRFRFQGQEKVKKIIFQ